MSRLDQHVSRVRNKLALGQVLNALAGASVILFGLLLVIVLVDKLIGFRMPRVMALSAIAGAATVLSALVVGLSRRPTAHAAAVAIDAALGLKEKFSTALFARRQSDAFSAAAVADAESVAGSADLSRKFPLRFPRAAYVALALAVLAGGLTRMNPLDLFGHTEQARKEQIKAETIARAKKTVEQALATVNCYPESLAGSEAVKLAKRDLENLLKAGVNDPAAANRSAMKALEDTSQAIAEKLKENEDFARMQMAKEAFGTALPAADEKGPVAEAQRELAKGNIQQAVEQMQKAADNFDKMAEKDQKKAAEQMKDLAAQLQKSAENPKGQAAMQKQLQQMGLDAQQAQQLAKAVQQAAQNPRDAQAQAQLQQAQKQLMDAMSPAQRAQAQKMLNQMQAQANNQAQAQAMSQAAKQMADAMNKQAQAGAAPKAGAQGQPNQADAQQMKDGLQAMQAIAADMKQMEAAAAAAQQGIQQAANNLNGQQPGANPGQGNKPGAAGQKGEWRAGDPKAGKGQGQGGPGIGNGGVASKSPAPFGTKTEMSPSQDNDAGKVLASSFIKAGTIKGESKAQLSNVAASAIKDAPDEVEQDRVSRQAQQVVKEYFETMQKPE